MYDSEPSGGGRTGLDAEIPCAIPVAAEAALPADSRWRQRRGHRVVLLLILLWILNGFDLAFTIMAHGLGDFNEANPIARRMLDPPIRVIVFKVSSVVFASGIFLIYRRRVLVEAGCWIMCAIYVAICVLWGAFWNSYQSHLNMRWMSG